MKKQNENTTENTTPGGGGGESVPGTVVTGDSDGQNLTPESVTLTELRTENEQLKTSIRIDAAHRQITGELAKIGARSPELLFDSVKADLQFAEDGTVGNAAALIGKLKTNFPEQFGREQPGPIDGGAGTGGGNTLTRSALAKMKPAQIAALDWSDVRRVLAGS